MEPVLLFETSCPFEDSTDVDKIRQSLIDVTMDPPSAEEAISLMSGVIDYLQAQDLSASIIDDIAVLMNSCFERYSRELAPVFQKLWERKRESLGLLVCTASSLSALKYSPIKDELPKDCAEFVKAALAGCQEKPARVFGFEIPQELQLLFVCHLLLSYDITKDQLESFKQLIFSEDVGPGMLEKLMRHIVQMGLVYVLPSNLFEKPGFFAHLSADCIAMILEQMPEVDFAEVANSCERVVVEKDNGNLSSVFLQRCRQVGKKLKRKVVHTIAKSLTVEHITADMLDVLQEYRATLPVEMLEKLPESPRPELVLKVFPLAWDSLKPEVLTQLLETTEDYETLEWFLRAPIVHPLLKTAEFWVRLVKLAPAGSSPPKSVCMTFEANVQFEWDVVKKVIVDTFPPTERYCKYLSGFLAPRGRGSPECFTEEHTLEILNSLVFEGDTVTTPCASFWQFISNVRALETIIMRSKYSPVFLEEYSFKCLSGVARNSLEDFELMKQTTESLAEVAKYARAAGHWFLSEYTISLTALSFIVHAHLFFATFKENSQGSVDLMREKVISKLDATTFYYFLAVICRVDQERPTMAGFSEFSCLNCFPEQLWAAGTRASIQDSNVADMLCVCLSHWAGQLRFSPDPIKHDLLNVIFQIICPALVDGSFKGDIKEVVRVILEFMSGNAWSTTRLFRGDAPRARSILESQRDSFLPWLINSPGLWPSKDVTRSMKLTHFDMLRAGTILSPMTENEDTAKNLLQFFNSFDASRPKLEIKKPEVMAKLFADAVSRKDWEIAEIVSSLLTSASCVQCLMPSLSQDIPASVKISIAGACSRDDLSVDFLVSLFSYNPFPTDESITASRGESGGDQKRVFSSEWYSLLHKALVDDVTAKYLVRFGTEFLPDRFCVTIPTLSRSRFPPPIGSDICDVSAQQWVKELARLYVRCPGTETLLLKPEFDELPPVPEFGKSLVDRLMASPEPNFGTFYWLAVIAFDFPFFVTDKMAAISLVNKHIASVFTDYYGVPPNERSHVKFAVGAAALMFLHFVLHTPEAMDLFVPWFFENVEGLTNSQLLGYLMLFSSMKQVESLSHVLLSLFLKNSLPEVSRQILVRSFESAEIRKMISHYVFSLNYMLYSFLGKAKAEAIVTSDEIAQSENPFKEAFDHSFFILRNHMRSNPFGTSASSHDIPETLDRLLHGIQKGAPGTLRMSFRNSLRDIETSPKPYDGPIPEGVSPEAFKQLPPRMQSSVLHRNAAARPALNPTIYRFLTHQPLWIVQWIKSKHQLILMPEHYTYLLPVFGQLASLASDQEEVSIDDFTLIHYCQGDFFATLVDACVSLPKEEKVPDSLRALFKELAKKESLFPILEKVNSVLSRPVTSVALKRILCLFEWMSDSQYFKDNFVDICASAVLEQVCSAEHRSHSSLLALAAKLFLPMENAPNKIIHLVIFMLDGKAKHTGLALDLCQQLGEARKEYVMPYVRIAFDKAVKDGTKDIVMFLSKIPEVATERHSELMQLLRNLLTNYRKSSLSVIGALFSALAPVRDRSQSIRLSDSLSIDASAPTPMRSLPIPVALRDQAPEFWELFAENRKLINQVIQNEPSLLRGTFKFLLQYPELVDFPVRVAIFHETMRSRIRGGTLNIQIRRNSILTDSFNKLKFVKIDQLMAPIHVRFLGEEGVDAGGVRRDWFSSLTKEIFNQDYALFTATSGGRSHQPNPASYVNQDHIAFFTFAGKVIARALVEGVNLDAHLTAAFCKHILKLPLSLRDLETVDESLHRSLKWMLDNEFDPEELDMRFVVDSDYMGRHETRELKENGQNILVTNQNKEEYVSLILEQRLTKQIGAQIKAFCEGFYAVIPWEDIRSFSPNELDLLICGVPEIDVADLRANCNYIFPYNAGHPVVQAFFEVISKWDNEALAKLLLFMTGSSQVPIEGFKYFVDIGQPITISPGGERGRLPVAHTCVNTIDLPEYTDPDEMNAKLQFAIHECDSFGII